MHRKDFRKFIYVIICVIFSSCTGTRFLKDGEKLYTGATIKLQSTQKIKHKKSIIKTAELAVRPKPNKKFLGMRPKLWFYFIAGDSAKKGFKKWVKNKLGEPPVLISQVKPAQTAKYIDAALFNLGIFDNITAYQIDEKKKTAHIIYTCAVHAPFKISAIHFPADDDLLSEFIRDNSKKSLIHPDDDYNLQVLKNERERIDAVLKENGYFYFNPDFLVFKADTNLRLQTVDLTLSLKDETPYKAMLIYRMNDVYVDPDYSLQQVDDTISKDTSIVDDVIFIGESKIRTKVILRSEFIRKNEVYSRKLHSMTLNRLMTMGNFKYVNVKFTESDSAHPGFLDARILLTPLPKYTFRTALTLVSKSNDFIGPNLNLNYRNKNAFGGAELLSFSLNGSVETQFTGKYKNLYSYEINPMVELYVPRFIVPFKIKNPTSFYIPKTKTSLSYTYLKRVGYFNQRSLIYTFGYKWKPDIKKEHELNIVNINLTSISQKTLEFNSLLEANPFLKTSYEEQFIAGVLYTFTYNEQVIPFQKNQLYFITSTELSGNALSLFKKVVSNQTASSEDPLSVAGSVYSQFARFTLDIRDYINLTSKSKFAFRLYTGTGVAYGNSSTLPYTRRFFSGGPNSIRAFQINSVGPGTLEPQADLSTIYLETGGDIKIEGNAEYRCNLFSILRGAVFIDAGNVWLLRATPEVDSQPFAFSSFYKELAVGGGIGLRADASFFVLRFDLAAPFRKPWLPENSRWVLNEINLGSPTWRKDNLVLSIAIGYPF
ncbi:MAG: BamA/TamA family outer membrane protein [Bacteroidia bacterium]